MQISKRGGVYLERQSRLALLIPPWKASGLAFYFTFSHLIDWFDKSHLLYVAAALRSEATRIKWARAKIVEPESAFIPLGILRTGSKAVWCTKCLWRHYSGSLLGLPSHIKRWREVCVRCANHLPWLALKHACVHECELVYKCTAVHPRGKFYTSTSVKYLFLFLAI